MDLCPNDSWRADHYREEPQQKERLYLARGRQAALSQQELAERAGTTQETISRLEHGHHAARGRTLRKLADVLNVEPKELMKGEGVD
jgi:transcriptional regulator with XRE-family HTH domain